MKKRSVSEHNRFPPEYLPSTYIKNSESGKLTVPAGPGYPAKSKVVDAAKVMVRADLKAAGEVGDVIAQSYGFVLLRLLSFLIDCLIKEINTCLSSGQSRLPVAVPPEKSEFDTEVYLNLLIACTPPD